VQETPRGRALIPTINRLCGWARSHGVPVLFTLEAHRRERVSKRVPMRQSTPWNLT